MTEHIKSLKDLVARNDLEAIQNYIYEIIINQTEQLMDPAYIFQKVYLHACLLKRKDIADWLEKSCFPLLEPIQQIAIRQCFPYGHVLLNKK